MHFKVRVEHNLQLIENIEDTQHVVQEIASKLVYEHESDQTEKITNKSEWFNTFKHAIE